MRKGPCFHGSGIRPERKVRLAFEEIKGRGYRCGVCRKLVPGGKSEQNHFHIIVIVECPAEDASLRDINFLDQLGCEEVVSDSR